MTRSPVGFWLCLLGLLSAIGLAACGGTETGNPSGHGSGSGGQKNPAITLVEEICEKLTSCFGGDDFTKEECEQAIADSEMLGAAFGIVEKPPPGFAEVIDKVENNELTANEEAVEECVDAIGSLGCDDPTVQAADFEEGFANVEEMIPETACSQVFSGP